MKYFYLIISLIVLCTSSVVAQQEITLQLMSNIFQSTHTNPAIIPRNKINITLLSSYHVDAKNTGFSYNQLLAQVEEGNEPGQRVLNLESMLTNLKLDRKNYMNIGGSVDMLAVGFKVGKHRFSLNITEKFQGRLYYNDGLFRTFVYGNSPEETINLSGYSFNALHYRELGLGYNRKILAENKLIVGGRLKILSGMANIHTQKSEVSIRTGSEAEMYALTANADILVKTAGLGLLEEGDESYFINTNNLGLGADLGATYQLDTKFSFAASLVNLGFIHWKHDVESYHSQGSFTFEGIDDDSIFTSSKFNVDPAQLADSIANIFKFKENNQAYSTGLPTQMYLSSFYQLALNTTASATLYSDFIGKGSFRRGLALGIRQNVGRWLQASATYSMQARSYNNLGLGLAFSSGGGGLQLYMVSDNILGVMNVGNSKLTNIRTGFNFVF